MDLNAIQLQSLPQMLVVITFLVRSEGQLKTVSLRYSFHRLYHIEELRTALIRYIII